MIHQFDVKMTSIQLYHFFKNQTRMDPKTSLISCLLNSCHGFSPLIKNFSTPNPFQFIEL